MKTIAMPAKDLIMILLRDHLVTYKLIQSLERIGLDTHNFDVFLGDTIFTLMGFGNSAEEEKLFEEFLHWSEKVLTMEFTMHKREPLQDLCVEIYTKLKREKKLRKLK